MLLSGHDGGLVIFWRKAKDHKPPVSGFDTFHEDQKHNQETWTCERVMRCVRVPVCACVHGHGYVP